MLPLTATLFSQLLRDVGQATIEVHGSSMLPVILPGDLLRVEAGAPSIGDVVVFLRDNRVCAHRVVRITDCTVITLGDANSDPDPCVNKNDILGRVTSLERYGTTVFDLRPRRVTSTLLGNSSLLRRIYLRVRAMRWGLQSPPFPRRSTGVGRLQA